MRAAPLLWMFAAHAFAQDQPWQIRAGLQIVRLPQREALAFVPRLNDPQTAVAAFAELQAGIENGKIRLVSDLSGTAVNYSDGGKFWQVAGQNFGVLYKRDDPQIGPSPEHFAKATKPIANSYPMRKIETRDCGASLEFTAGVYEDGKMIFMQLTAGMTEFVSWTRYETGTRRDGLKLYVERPKVAVRRTAGELNLAPGVPQLFGLYTLPGPPPTVELHVVTATLRDLRGFPNRIPPTSPRPDPTPEEAKVAEFWKDRFRTTSRVEIHRFHVAQREALKIRREMLDPGKVEEAHDRLLALTTSGAVQLVEWHLLPFGVNGDVESENYYELQSGTDGAEPQGPAPRKDRIGDPPGDFETAQIGSALKCDDHLGGEIPSLNMIYNVAEHEGFKRWAFGTDRADKDSYIYQPTIKTRRMEMHVPGPNGQRVLMRFSRLREGFTEEGGGYEIVLVRSLSRNVLTGKLIESKP